MVLHPVGHDSPVNRQGVVHTHAGPEMGVASTKAYTAQLAMLYLLALKLAKIRGTLSAAETRNFVKALRYTPSLYNHILHHTHAITKIGHDNAHFGCFLFLGRNSADGRSGADGLDCCFDAVRISHA